MIRDLIDIPIHPAADVFPFASDEEFNALTASIKAVGLQHPVTLFDGAILDGRNRYAACKSADVTPDIEEYDGADPWQFVWDENGPRRNISEMQRYACWSLLSENSAALRSRLERIAEDGNKKRSETQKGKPKNVAGHDTPPRLDSHPGREAKAEAANVGGEAVKRMDRLRVADPELHRAVARGEVKPMAALRELKKREVSERVAALPDGVYRVIYADPPWSYGDTREGLDGYEDSAAAGQYPTMSKAELCALGVGSLAADDCVLFCWATFPLLPDALEVVKAWGFAYKTAFVWSKIRPNLGHYHRADAELLLVATRGSGTPDDVKRERQVQEIERTGKHSEKPEGFRAMIDRMYAGNRIELFRRGDAPDGWEIWGNEADDGA